VFAAFVSREMDAPATLTAILSRYRQAKCPLSCRVNQLLEQRNATQRSLRLLCNGGVGKISQGGRELYVGEG
jgi:hypothetical protein